jgi:DNA-binding transcriptional LysR family regulator
MTLEQLRIFVGVAEREHMTRAAEALHVTQSAASASIAALESHYGVALFHRVGRGIELTDAGRAFLAEARAVLGCAASAELALSEFGALTRGTLRLVASHTITGYWLPRHLAAFRERHPRVAVELAIANTDRAAQRVLSGAAELSFVEGAVDQPLLQHRPLTQDRLVLVSQGPVEAVDDGWLREARWILREPGSGTRSTFEETLRQRGLDPDRLEVALTLPSNESVRTAVEAGAGVAVLPELVVARALQTGALHALPLPLPERTFSALQHRERRLGHAARALLDLIQETLA